jgi:nitroimidazol reductase NimA-like FMN-containing flavoprotein (pyridoxamine 5'-phosphate oxidase superfamily)
MRYRGSMIMTRPLSPMEAAAARQLLSETVYAYLAVVEPQGPYVVPLNFVYVEPPAAGPATGRAEVDAEPATAAAPAAAAEEAEAVRRGAGVLPGSIYFHTGKGRKTAALSADPRVCLAVTGGVAFRQGNSACGDAFSYRSLLLWGRARGVEDATARETALRAIVAKYDPEKSAAPFGEADFAQTLLYEVTIEMASYKQEPCGWQPVGK